MKKLLIFLIALVIGVVAWYVYALGPVDARSSERIKVTIEDGWTTTQIIDHLEKEDLIRSPLAFKLYLKMKGLDGSLQAGVYILLTSQSVESLTQVLQTGRAEEMSVTVPEGFTVLDIDQLLAELQLATEGEVLRCSRECDFSSFSFLPEDLTDLAERGGRLEGYLFPDTYYVPVDEFVAKFFLERMLGNFRKTILEPYEGLIEDTGLSVHEFVTMASLVEEETRTDEERPVVADILLRRHADGWGLGVDAAVRYIVKKPEAVITHADLNVNSPYNLRKFKGLSPGPIANPGKKSFEAVLYPKTSPYWYYLHAPDGQIHYSRTNEEHNTKRFLYLGGGSK